MAELSIFGTADSSAFSSASTTFYGGWGAPFAGAVGITTEVQAQSKFRGAATLKTIRARVGTNARSTDTIVAVRIAGADTALLATLTAGVTGDFAVTTDVAIADGDLWCYRLTSSTGTGNITVSITGSYETSGQSSGWTGTQNTGSTFTTASSSTYMRPAAFAAHTTTTTDAEQAMGIDGVASNFQVYVSANTRGTSTTVRPMVGGADVNQLVTVTATTTGLIEDTSNTDTITDTSLIRYKITNGTGGGNFTTIGAYMKVTPSTANHSFAIAGTQPGNPLGTGVTRYSGLWGPTTRATARTDSQASMPYAGTASNLTVTAAQNNSTTTVTTILEKNGSAGNQTVSITAATNGVFQDTTNSDTFTTGDLLNYASSGATTGTIRIQGAAMLLVASGDTNVALTGVSATGALGSLGKTLDIALAGLALTAALGTITPVFNIPLTGLGLTGSLGTVTPIITIDVALTGVSATTALGSLGKTFDIALSGVEATLGLGTVSPPAAAASITRVRTGSVAIGAFVRPETNSFTRPENRARSRVQIRTLR